MAQTQIIFQVNDFIVHASHGIGKIEGIVTKTIRGEKQVFYTVRTPKLTYWLELTQSQSDRIRMVRKPSTFKKALSLIRKKPKVLDGFFRTRIKYIKEEIAKCSILANAELIRDMHARDMDKGLHLNENNMLVKLREQFVNEWALSADITKETVEGDLSRALQVSMAK